MKTSYVIKKALLSEKAYSFMESGIYSFFVNKTATKYEIKKAVEKQFSVKVKKVNVLTMSGKKKKISGTRKQVSTGVGKKALVYLIPGQSIALLSPKKEAEKKTSKVSKAKESLKDNKEKKGLLSRIGKSKQEKNQESKKEESK